MWFGRRAPRAIMMMMLMMIWCGDGGGGATRLAVVGELKRLGRDMGPAWELLATRCHTYSAG